MTPLIDKDPRNYTLSIQSEDAFFSLLGCFCRMGDPEVWPKILGGYGGGIFFWRDCCGVAWAPQVDKRDSVSANWCKEQEYWADFGGKKSHHCIECHCFPTGETIVNVRGIEALRAFFTGTYLFHRVRSVGPKIFALLNELPDARIKAWLELSAIYPRRGRKKEESFPFIVRPGESWSDNSTISRAEFSQIVYNIRREFYHRARNVKEALRGLRNAHENYQMSDCF